MHNHGLITVRPDDGDYTLMMIESGSKTRVHFTKENAPVPIRLREWHHLQKLIPKVNSHILLVLVLVVWITVIEG